MGSLPHLDECRYLILKIIEQSVRDFINLEDSTAPIDRKHYDTACNFLFDNEYTIDYGGEDKTLSDLLDILDLDIEWLRVKAISTKKRKLEIIKLRRLQNARKKHQRSATTRKPKGKSARKDLLSCGRNGICKK